MADRTGLQAAFEWRRGALALDVDLRLPAQGVSALFGPSGAGKTSVLRIVAGLEAGAHGTVRFDDAFWQDSATRRFVPAHQRHIGYIDQHASLFGHLNVAGNLDYGFRRAGRPAHVDRDALVDAFGVRALLPRRVGALSGGERQRVALVRALASDPQLLLCDEPLSALDADARRTLMAQVERARTLTATPLLWVSHAIDEVARLADHLVLLDAGKVVAQGPVQQVLTRMDLPAALEEAVGAVIEGDVTARDATEHLTTVRFAGGELVLPDHYEDIGTRMRCRVAARDVVIALEAGQSSSAINRWPARVVAMAPAAHPAQCLVRLDANGCALVARITRRSWHTLALEPGRQVWAQVKAATLGTA